MILLMVELEKARGVIDIQRSHAIMSNIMGLCSFDKRYHL